jgi:hypothetical protein
MSNLQFDLLPDDLLKIQRALQRRAVQRDPGNHLAIGFGPRVRGGIRTAGLCARYFVSRKKRRVSAQSRVPECVKVRWRSAPSGQWRTITLDTDVCQCAPPSPSGVEVRSHGQQATTALVIAWTTKAMPLRHTPSLAENRIELDDPQWHLGLVSVAHAFPPLRRSVAGNSGETRVATRRSPLPPEIERLVRCDGQPTHITGTLAARGRLPGDPDCALLETGFDSLWLSSFFSAETRMARFLPTPTAADINRLVQFGGQGYLSSLRHTSRWEFDSYFPERSVEGLGRQQHVMQIVPAVSSVIADNPPALFAPGTSGSILTDGGMPLAMQFAANKPHYDVALAQLLTHSMPWLQSYLQATFLGILRVF